jgi:hypothetical protein
MMSGWQLILGFVLGIIVTIIIFIVAINTVRIILLSLVSGIKTNVQKEADRARKEVRSHFGLDKDDD